MTTSDAPLLRLRSAADILAAVPYLLGFHPADSLVVLGLRGIRLVFHARLDLPPAGTPPPDLQAMAGELTGLFTMQRVGEVILVGFGPPDRVGAPALAVRDSMRDAGFGVVEVLRADRGRYWSYTCSQACCPPCGTPYRVSDSVVAATATVAGCVALADRETVVRSLDPPSGTALAAIREAGQRAAARLVDVSSAGEDQPAGPRQGGPRQGAPRLRAQGRAAVRAALDRYAGADRLGDDEVAWLSVVLAASVPVRDWAWRRVDGDPSGPEAHARLWADVVRRCDPTLVPAPAVLLAYTQWRMGDGVRASVAIDRALAADPGYLAARLLAEVLRRAIPPTAVPSLVSGVDRGRRRRPRAADRSTR
jgi:hypothetical protein